jgi:Fe-S cluster assembly iron-binding protein IscA
MTMPIISIDPPAHQAITALLAEKQLPCSIRIEIRSTGCCDASLGIAISDCSEDDDTVESLGNLQIRISPSLYQLVGNISISYHQEYDQVGFMITSERPLNEWAGFATSCLRL